MWADGQAEVVWRGQRQPPGSTWYSGCCALDEMVELRLASPAAHDRPDMVDRCGEGPFGVRVGSQQPDALVLQHAAGVGEQHHPADGPAARGDLPGDVVVGKLADRLVGPRVHALVDRKSTRLNSSHPSISYAVFCLKKKKNK